MSRDHILAEIKRVSAQLGGQGVGRRTFERETGIRENDWLGRYWVRWSDALAEAGLDPNQLQVAYGEEAMLEALALATRELHHVPNRVELAMRARARPGFPWNNTFQRRFGNRREMTKRLSQFCAETPAFADVLPLCKLEPEPDQDKSSEGKRLEVEFGSVYMLKSGHNYKIGRSNAFGRREREIALQLPEKAGTVHVIRTDDPEGIEAYWHRRFADKRRNGEWFALTPEDVSAFRRRKFM